MLACYHCDSPVTAPQNETQIPELLRSPTSGAAVRAFIGADGVRMSGKAYPAPSPWNAYAYEQANCGICGEALGWRLTAKQEGTEPATVFCFVETALVATPLN